MTEIILILNDLQLDIIKLIGSFIDMRDFWSFCLICKSFSRVCFNTIYVDWKLGSFLRKLVPPKILESGRLIDAYRKFKNFQPNEYGGCFKFDLSINQLAFYPYNAGWKLLYIKRSGGVFCIIITENYLYLDEGIGIDAIWRDNLFKPFGKLFRIPKINEFKFLSCFFQHLWDEIENRGTERLKDKCRDYFRMLIRSSLEISHINCP